MPFSSINRYIIIPKRLGRAQLFPPCHVYHFDTHSTGSTQYKSHALPLRGEHRVELEGQAAVASTHPCLSTSTFSTGYARQLRASAPRDIFPAPGSSLEEAGGPSSDSRHFWPNWAAPHTVTAGCVPAGWELHHHAARDRRGRVRKKRNRNTNAKQTQPGSRIFSVLRGLTGALPGPSLRGVRTWTRTHSTHAAAFRNRSDILPLLHSGN